jgi:hypothetical protein
MYMIHTGIILRCFHFNLTSWMWLHTNLSPFHKVCNSPDLVHITGLSKVCCEALNRRTIEYIKYASAYSPPLGANLIIFLFISIQYIILTESVFLPQTFILQSNINEMQENLITHVCHYTPKGWQPLIHFHLTFTFWWLLAMGPFTTEIIRTYYTSTDLSAQFAGHLLPIRGAPLTAGPWSWLLIHINTAANIITHHITTISTPTFGILLYMLYPLIITFVQ